MYLNEAPYGGTAWGVETAAQTYFGKKVDEKGKKILRGIFRESGAIEYGKYLIEDNIKKAKELLKKEKIAEKYKDLFFKFIDILSKRKS